MKSLNFWILRILNVPIAIRRRVRRRMLLREISQVGRNFVCDPLDTFQASHLRVGNDVFIAEGARIVSGAGATIHLQDGVMIGPNVTILGGDHNFNVVGKRTRDDTEHGARAEIILEEDVWCGANVTILKGVRIGEGAVVGAGSVVSRCLAPYTICAGSPCRPRKLRFDDADLRKHLQLLGRRPEDVTDMVKRRNEETGDMNLRA